MPQSTRKKSISSVLNSGKFELLSKNKVSLGNDEELSFDYKPLKIGDLASPIEFTQDKLRINTDLEFDGNLLSHSLKTDNLYLEFRTGSSGYHRFLTKANTSKLDLWVLAGTTYWIYDGHKTQYIGLTSQYTWAQANLSADPVVAQNMAVLQAASDNETSFRIFRTGDSGDFAKISIKDAGEFILTATADSGDGFFTIKNEVATLLTITEAALTVTGDIILDDGGSIKEAGGTAAITIDASGEVTKIGQDTPSDGQVLKWHASTSKVVWENESGGGGASALNDLSDVTYSSGDLTITSLDKFIFGGAVDYDLSGDITFTENGASFSFLTIDYDAETIELKGNSGNTSLTAQIFTTGSTGRLKCDDVLRLESGSTDVSNPNIEFGSAGGNFAWGIVGGSFLSHIEWNLVSNTYKYMNSFDRDDYYQMTVGTHGATTLATVCDSGDNAANLTLDIDGDIELNADGGNITFKDASTSLAEISGSGILSKTVIYFDAETANTIGDGATGVIDWTVNQKQKVTITGTSITCNFTNPPGPCNLMLKVIQGDGSDVIGTWDSDIKWPSNTPPTLSTANGAIDIISFYFDGTNYFGVGSLNFS